MSDKATKKDSRRVGFTRFESQQADKTEKAKPAKGACDDSSCQGTESVPYTCKNPEPSATSAHEADGNATVVRFL